MSKNEKRIRARTTGPMGVFERYRMILELDERRFTIVRRQARIIHMCASECSILFIDSYSPFPLFYIIAEPRTQ